MMRKFAFFVFLSCSLVAYSKTLRAFEGKVLHQVAANLGVGCNIRIEIPVVDEFRISRLTGEQLSGLWLSIRKSGRSSSPPVEWNFQLVCRQDDDERVGDVAGRLDPVTGRWVKDMRQEEEELKNTSDSVDRAYLSDLIRTVKVIDIKTPNAHGWAMTAEDVTGDERFRRKGASFCVIKPPRSLCGGSQTGYVEEIKRNPKADLTPLVLKILKSIEFLEDVPPADSTGK